MLRARWRHLQPLSDWHSPAGRPAISGSGTQEAYSRSGRGSAYWGSADHECVVPNRRPWPRLC